MHRRRSRAWPRVAALFFLGMTMAARTASATDTPSLDARRMSGHTTGVISLSTAGTLDWVKWGFPEPGTSTVFRGDQDPSSVALSRKILQTPLIGALHAGSRTDGDSVAAQTPSSLWRYADHTDLASLKPSFTWSATGSTQPMSAGQEAIDGILLLDTPYHLNIGWGFSFTVETSTTLRELDLYLWCGSSVDVEVTVAMNGAASPSPVQFCYDSGEVDKINIQFATDSGHIGSPLTVGVYTADAYNATPGPAVLLAAALLDAPVTTGTAGAGGGPGGAGGSGGGGGTGGGGTGGASVDAGAPDGACAPFACRRSVLQCDLAPGGNAPGPGALAALVLAVAVAFRPRRRSR